MIFNWYNLFNKTEFEAEDIPSRSLLVQLEGRGGREVFEIFKGNETCVQYGDAFLPINFLDNNPYVQGSYGVYLDANDDVWFGFEADD